jgi:hypothetical protein
MSKQSSSGRASARAAIIGALGAIAVSCAPSGEAAPSQEPLPTISPEGAAIVGEARARYEALLAEPAIVFEASSELYDEGQDVVEKLELKGAAEAKGRFYAKSTVRGSSIEQFRDASGKEWYRNEGDEAPWKALQASQGSASSVGIDSFLGFAAILDAAFDASSPEPGTYEIKFDAASMAPLESGGTKYSAREGLAVAKASEGRLESLSISYAVRRERNGAASTLNATVLTTFTPSKPGEGFPSPDALPKP